MNCFAEASGRLHVSLEDAGKFVTLAGKQQGQAEKAYAGEDRHSECLKPWWWWWWWWWWW
jgi:hypothetical protein